MLKKIMPIMAIIMFFMIFNTVSYAEFYSSLPADIGSNSKIMKILCPGESKVTTTENSYLISFYAEPGTEITLYERYDDSLFVPLTINNESITGKVGNSGLYLIDLPLKRTNNRIMFFAQKGKKYQTAIRTISIIQSENKIIPKVEYSVISTSEIIENTKKIIENKKVKGI